MQEVNGWLIYALFAAIFLLAIFWALRIEGTLQSDMTIRNWIAVAFCAALWPLSAVYVCAQKASPALGEAFASIGEAAIKERTFKGLFASLRGGKA